jgi:hypothetical protein
MRALVRQAGFLIALIVVAVIIYRVMQALGLGR